MRSNDLAVGDEFCVPASYGSPTWYTLVEKGKAVCTLGDGPTTLYPVTVVRKTVDSHGAKVDKEEQKLLASGLEVIVKWRQS